eukprot:COSAG01_NODE_7400_length_3222_cov_2.875760_4_plen_112_part_00
MTQLVLGNVGKVGARVTQFASHPSSRRVGSYVGRSASVAARRPGVLALGHPTARHPMAGPQQQQQQQPAGIAACICWAETVACFCLPVCVCMVNEVRGLLASSQQQSAIQL